MKFTNQQIIIIFGVAISLPLFFLGIKGHDTVDHLILSRLFAEQFFSGDFYPRWLFGAETSLGSPVLYHWPVLGYYITLIFYPLHLLDKVLNLPQGYLALYASALSGMAVSGIAMHKYLALKTAPNFALLGALLYMAAAYHCGIDLYYRFAFSEIWAFALIPLALYYFEKNSRIGTAFIIAALVLCHLLTVIIFLPVFILLIIMQKKYELLLSVILGFGLAAIYLIPAISGMDMISSAVNSGIYSPFENFITFSTPEGKYMAMAALLTLAPIISTWKKQDRETVLWLIVLIGSLFMTLPISSFIWHFIPKLGVISFPWRFLLLSTLASVILLPKLDNKIAIMLIMLNLALSLPGIMAKNSQDPAPYINSNTRTLDDFRGKWLDQAIISDGQFIVPAKLEALHNDDASLQFKPRRIIIHARKSGLLTLPQFYFPYWQSDYEITPQAKTGLMQINLPAAGDYELKLIYSRSEKIGLAVSILCLLLLAGQFMLIRAKRLKGL